jgi:branched-chain amino acid transport system substrate-binding protein
MSQYCDKLRSSQKIQSFGRDRLCLFTAKCCFFLLLLFSSPTSFSEDRLKIGVSLPLTGPAASYGSDIKNILNFANSKIGDRYDFIFEDDKCNGREAVAIANKFINQDRIKFVTGFACSGALMAAAPVYERGKVLALGLISASKNISNAGDYIFRSYPSNASYSPMIANFIFTKYEHLAVLSEETEFAQSFLEGLKTATQLANKELSNADFNSSDSDQRSAILKLKAAKTEALFINAQTEASFVNILRQVKSLGWQVPVFSAFFAASPVVLKDQADLVEGVYVLDTPWPEQIQNPENRKIYNLFKQEFGGMQSVEMVFQSAYDGFRALDLAIKAGASADQVKDYFYKQTFDGLVGPWTFDHNGDVQGYKFVIKVLHKGKAQILKHDGK